MTEALHDVETEGESLAELLEEYEHEQAEEAAEAARPDPADLERARKLAEKMNGGFLWVVNRTQCPHVKIDEVVDRKQGDEAFIPLAEKWGGEVPPWLAVLEPYIAAGVYMGTTIASARQAEALVIEDARRRAQQHNQGAPNGQESQPGAE